jgi:sortase (surface protein transpeptidase)
MVEGVGQDDLRKGDRILIAMQGWTFAYMVSRTQIVLPTEVWVLDDVPGPAASRNPRSR